MTPPGQLLLTQPGRPVLASAGPGLAFTRNPSSVLLFFVAEPWRNGDLIHGFWTDDFPRLDWCADYLLNTEIALLQEKKDLEGWGDEEEDMEEMWARDIGRNLETDSDYDTGP